MPAVFFVVRATVPDAAKRKAFDTWYQREHLPDTAKSFGVTKAWRFWSLTDPSLHQATYQFSDEASLDRDEGRGHEAADRRLQPRLAGCHTHARDLCAGGGIFGVAAAELGYPRKLNA